jgi:hypothetical protein
MSFHKVTESNLVGGEASAAPQNGGNLPDSAPATADSAPVPAPVPALARFYWERGILWGDEERLLDDDGEPTNQWAAAGIAGCLICDRKAGFRIAFAYDATLAEKIVAALNAGAR